MYNRYKRRSSILTLQRMKILPINVNLQKNRDNQFQYYSAMDIEQKEGCQLYHEEHPQTIGGLVDSISFYSKIDRPKKKKKNQMSETSSISSCSSFDQSEKSKVWTFEQQQLFRDLLKKYGTDFNFFRAYFPKKSKNQIKNKYKQIFIQEKKETKVEEKKLKALSNLFKEEQIEEDPIN